MRAVRIVVRGWVQGVGFRFWAVRRAKDLGLEGWVRNLPDGDVEAEAKGEEEALRQFVESMRTGPRSAVVQDVVEQWFDAPDVAATGTGFHVVS